MKVTRTIHIAVRVLSVMLLGLLSACGSSAAKTAATGAHPGHHRFFSPSSVWNRPLPATARIDRRSPAIVGNFLAEIAAQQSAGHGPGINTDEWSVPIYKVPAGQPRVPVTLRSRPLRAPPPALQEAWSSVPLPGVAEPAEGTDRPLVVWQPSSDSLWEFWGVRDTPEGVKAAWGGAIDDVSDSRGVYGPRAWPGADSSWGASASSLSIVGGLITFADWRSGRIEHALSMSIPEVRAGVYAAPANRTDGSSPNPLALPEGAHLRLDPHLDLGALDLPRPTLMLARAAQRYGIVVRDHAGAVVFTGQDPVTLRGDPYVGPDGYFDGYRPWELMAAFPWSHLELLKMHLHRYDCQAHYLRCP